MQGKEQLSPRQFSVLIFMYTIGTTILVIPSGLAATAKQDAWIGAIAGLCLNLLVVYLFTKLWSLFPELSFVGICKAVLGKYLGTLVSLLFIFYSFIGSTTVLYYVGDFVTSQILKGTPQEYLIVLFAIVVITGVRLGIEVLARTAEIFIPWFIVLYLFFVVMISPNIDITNIQPIFESGFKPIFYNALAVAGTASLPFLSFFMIFPNVNNRIRAKKGFYLATIIGNVPIIMVTLLSILVLGPELTERNIYPTYVLAKKINIGNFLQRIEIIIAILWFITTFFKSSIYFYGMLSSTSEVLKLSNYRVLSYPLGIIVIVFSQIIYPNITYMMNWDSKIYIPYIFTIAFLLPLTLLIVALIKKRFQKNKVSDKSQKK